MTEAFGRNVQGRLSEASTRAIAEHLTAVAVAQVNRLSSFILDTYEQAGAAKRAAVDQFLFQHAAVELTRNASVLAQSAAALPGLKGIADILLLIKKIIDFIFDHFFDKPPWLEGLKELIDEIVGTILGLLSIKLQRDVNQTEIDHLRAMYHLKRLRLLEHVGVEDLDSD